MHGALKFRFAHFNQVPSSCSPLQSCEPRRPFTEYHAVRLSTWTGGCVSMETENADHPAVTSTLYTTAATPLPSPRLSLPCPSVCVCVGVHQFLSCSTRNDKNSRDRSSLYITVANSCVCLYATVFSTRRVYVAIQSINVRIQNSKLMNEM